MQNLKPYLLLLPCLCLIVLLAGGGIVQAFGESIGYGYFGKGFSLDAYARLLQDEGFLDSLFLTVKIGLIGAGGACFFGAAILYLLYTLRFDGDSRPILFISRIIQIPIVLPYIVSAYLMFLLLTQSGFGSRVLYHAGLIEDMRSFFILVHDSHGIGIVLAYWYKTIPFVVLMLLPTLLGIHPHYYEIASVYGADKWHFFRFVVLPSCATPLKISFLIIMGFILSDFEIPFLLGSTHPQVLSVKAYLLYARGLFEERPDSMAINMVLITLSLCICVVVYSLTSRFVQERSGFAKN